MLTCPVCLAKFGFVSEMICHISDSKRCSEEMLNRSGRKKKSSIWTDIDCIVTFQQIFCNRTCDVCGIIFDNVMAYMLHKDHHHMGSTGDKVTFILKCGG